MDVSSYCQIANGPFAPLYPYYAARIVEQTGMRAGSCLDVGCGCGHFGLAVASITDMRLCLLDQSAKMLAQAAQRVREQGMVSRTRLVEGAVESMPLETDGFDLVISRGSIPFWSDLPAAFCEIWRVLKPGGYACVGGGLGPAPMREAIRKAMREQSPRAVGRNEEKIPQRSVEEYEQALRAAEITGFEIERGDEGTWIRFQKQ